MAFYQRGPQLRGPPLSSGLSIPDTGSLYVAEGTILIKAARGGYDHDVAVIRGTISEGSH